MRIVGGTLKGRRVELKASAARPTSDKVREALFSILYDRVEDARFLDLFTGSGCVGLEALSRGASRAVFCDRDPRAIAALRDNLTRFGVDPAAFELQTASYDVLCRKLQGRGEVFDLIYLDPPYDAGLYQSALEWGSRLLAAGGWIIAEHRSGTELPGACFGLTRLQCRRYGTQCLSIYAQEVPE